MWGLQQPVSPRPSLSALLAPSQDTGSGEEPREREEMQQPGLDRGQAPRASPAPLPAPLQVGCRSLSPAGSKFPQTQPGVPGRASWTASGRSYGAQDTAGSREGGPGGCRGGVQGGEGRMRLRLTCYTQVGPCLTLPQSAFLRNGRRRATLETERPGGGLEQGTRPSSAWLGSGQPPAGGPYRRCPWLWLLAPVLLTWAPGARASASACGDGGGLGPGWAVGTRP